MPSIEWITPKTNWSANDFIEYTDINRIVNNLEFLKRYAYSLFKIPYEPMTYKEEMQIPYADEINAIENNLESLNMNGYKLAIGNKQTFSENKMTMNYVELNRIESATLKLYERIKLGRQSLHMMKFTLGTQKGFRR